MIFERNLNILPKKGGFCSIQGIEDFYNKE